jgi:nucleoside-diphosphate-sugar epimerase
MMESILLTGGTGMVGQSIAKLLVEKGYKVIVMHRGGDLPLGVLGLYYDIVNSDEDLDNLCPEIDLVIHFAATIKPGNSENEKIEIQKVNIDFTRHLLNFSVKRKIKRFVFASSFSFIQKPLPKIVTEFSPVNPTFFYAYSKKISEEIIHEYYNRYGLNFTILRISSPVSFQLDKMHETVVKKWISNAIKKNNLTLYGSGSRSQDFVAVSDIANSVYLSLIKNINGIFNIASGTSLSLNELAEMIKSKFGVDCEHYPNDEEGVDAWNISIENSTRKLGYNPAYTAREAIAELIKNAYL